MYKSFYNLTRGPFDLSPDPTCFVATERHNEALAALYYGIVRHKGVVVVTGEVGTGKTLMLRCLLQLFKSSSEISYAYLFNCRLSPMEFLHYIASDFGLKADAGQSKSSLLIELSKYVTSRGLQGLTTVLIVDEAHNLSMELLEEIRLLSNLETNDEGKIRLPINITVDKDGTRYVSDTGRAQILVYDSVGNFLEAMGKKDEMKPSDVAITTDRLYIADLLNHCVRVYNKADRKFLFSIPADSKTAQGKLLSPTNLTVDQPGGRLLVSDTGGNDVQVYDLEGKYLRTIGRAGVAPGLFARPKGVAVDHAGLAYVVDAATQVVQIFDQEGRLMLFFGQAGASTQGEVVSRRRSKWTTTTSAISKSTSPPAASWNISFL